MVRILFLVLWIFTLVRSQAFASIEIDISGQQYDSFQAYVASKKPVVVPLVSSVSLKDPSDASLYQLYALGVEDGVDGALRDFNLMGVLSDPSNTRKIFFDQLQEAIEQEVTVSKDPKMLISRPGRLRIMSLTAQK